MADDFGTAIYTSCAPGQGLAGVGGMQFQARSSGVDRETLDVIRRHLIYEPPERLIRERQPIETFPPSFAHVYDGIFATAAGVYIGREADGHRQGNHLTHAIVTGDARTYHSVRPAQMFHAPFWRKEPAPSTHTECLAASWKPGPLDATEVSRFVNSQPDGGALLTALLAALLALLGGDTRRVLFISETPEPVLSWLTAATLLIPHEAALRIGFKVFTADPVRSALPVIAVHPGWTRSTVTVKDDHGYAVFDLIKHRWTAVPEPPEAGHWAKLFCEADPFDVSDAVELAAASGLSGDAASDLATAALLGGIPAQANVDVLVHWLQTGPPTLREAYGGRLVDALARLPDPKLLQRIDYITEAQFPSRSDGMRLALLRQELDYALRCQATSWSAPHAGSSPLASDRAPRTVSAVAKPEAIQLVTECLRQAQGTAFDAVLRVAAQFGVSVALDKVGQATAAFVASWAEDPTAGYDPSAWPQDPPVYTLLLNELSSRILRQPSVAAVIADQWWSQLRTWTPDQVDITSPLHCALLSAAMAHSDSRARLHIVQGELHRIDSTAGTHYGELAAVLWGRSIATTQELRALCDIAPADTDLDPYIFANLVIRAKDDPSGLPELELCADLSKKRLLSLDAETTELLACHRLLQDLESYLNTAALWEDLNEHLYRLPSRLINAHAGKLAHGLLAIGDPLRVVNLVQGMPQSVAVAYLEGLCRNAGRWRQPVWMAVAFAVSWLPDWWWARVNPHGDLRNALVAAVSERRSISSKKETKEVAKLLAPLGDGYVDEWQNGSGEVRRFGLSIAWFGSSPQRKRPDR